MKHGGGGGGCAAGVVFADLLGTRVHSSCRRHPQEVTRTLATSSISAYSPTNCDDVIANCGVSVYRRLAAYVYLKVTRDMQTFTFSFLRRSLRIYLLPVAGLQ